MGKELETSKESGAHAMLQQLVGSWEGTTRVWFEPSTVADESPVAGTMRLVLDGRFILHEYKGSFGGKPLEGMAFYGFHTGLQQFQSAWIDSFHNDTAIMFSKGEKGNKNCDVLGSYAYVTPEAEVHWGWRTTIHVSSPEELVITAYNISPEGEETKATETVYKKVTI